MRLSIVHSFRPQRRTARTRFLERHIGLERSPPPHVSARQVELDIRRGDVVLFTGPSGSGKSSLLGACARRLGRRGRVLWPEALDLPRRALVDALALPIEPALLVLSHCGLAEARLLLRSPRELSDGQRFRFRVALALAALVADPDRPAWLAVDEFASILDRPLARVLAINLRRLAGRHAVGLLLATAHEDLASDLRPDLHVRGNGDGDWRVFRPGKDRNSAAGWSTPDFFPSSESAKAPDPTGRTFLGGIIEAAAWGRCGGSPSSGTGTCQSASASSAARRLNSGFATRSSLAVQGQRRGEAWTAPPRPGA